MIPRVLGTSRFLILIAVVGSYFAATTLMIYGGFTVFYIIRDTVNAGTPNPTGAKDLMVACIELIDLFLLCVVLYIIASGLYKLFVGPINIPQWLQVRSLDELKAQLINVVIVLLAVTFLGQVVTQHGGIDILYLGIGISLVTAALVYTMRFGHQEHGAGSHDAHSHNDHAHIEHNSEEEAS
jgi:uncharacterized membrane protein YqhA